MNRFAGVCVLCAVILACVASPAAEPPSGDRLPVAKKEEFPPVKLRGYGTLSGTLWQSSEREPASSVLRVNCDNDAKAKVLHAKFLSDIGLLPGVTTNSLTALGHKVVHRVVAQQGLIAAVRAGRTVFLLTAANSADLEALVV